MLQIFGITGVYILSAGVYAAALLLILAVQLPTLVRRTVPRRLFAISLPACGSYGEIGNYVGFSP